MRRLKYGLLQVYNYAHSIKTQVLRQIFCSNDCRLIPILLEKDILLVWIENTHKAE